MSIKNECRLIPSVAGLKIEATEATFYLYDHLGNTRVTYTPVGDTVLSDQEIIIIKH